MTTRPTGGESSPASMLSRNPFGSPVGFIKDTIAEIKRVTWPTREEATRLTVMVITVSVVVGVILGLFDIGFSNLVRKVFI
jgi:preprotein translocase subunit SecE